MKKMYQIEDIKNKIICGDCLEELKKIPENSIDSIVTDPPYGLGFMGKEWDTFNPDFIENGVKRNLGSGSKQSRGRNDTSPAWVSARYDRSYQGLLKFYQWYFNVMKECLRVLKPGGYLLSFGGTRTYHRMACAIEDAGFEIRDCIMWVYGSGFPKSLNIGKQIDKIRGNKREDLGIRTDIHSHGKNCRKTEVNYPINEPRLTKGNSEWEGWGTALKPAVELTVVARKPLSEKNVASNVLKWGTGGINIDESRIKAIDQQKLEKFWNRKQSISAEEGRNAMRGGLKTIDLSDRKSQGRFPANLILNEESAKELDRQSGESKSTGGNIGVRGNKVYGQYGKSIKGQSGLGDTGGASRFFYVAKASRSERNRGLENLPDKPAGFAMRDDKFTRENMGNTPADKREPVKNNHPTVKPLKLMEYLVRLVTPPKGIVLDPFIGSGTTAIAAKKLGFNYIGIEKEKEYVKIAEARISA